MNVRLAAEAMGTRFELVLSGEDEFFLRSVGEQALEAVEAEHRRLSLFDPASAVSRINAHAHARPVPLDADLYDLLALASDVWDRSEHAFDPALGAHMRRWGHREGVGLTDAEPASFDAVRLDPLARTLRFDSPGASIDLGGIAKGYALDRAGQIVREAGVNAALLHGGTSSILAIGAPPGMRGWRVRLADHAGAPELTLRDTAAAVSAPAGRLSDAGDAHIIDPRSGNPVPLATEAAVVAPSATLADAWATALVVLSHRPDRMPPEIASAIHTNGRWSVSPAMRAVFEAQSRGSAPQAEQE